MTVYDLPDGNHRAYGSATMSRSHGARGKAIWNFGDQQWEIVSCQTLSQKIIVGCTSSATPSIAASATFTASSITIMDPGGQDISNGGASYPTIQSYSSAIQAAGGNVTGIVCLWNESAVQYLVIDGPC